THYFSPATVCQQTHIEMTPQPYIRPFAIPLFGRTRLPITLMDYHSAPRALIASIVADADWPS
ncbi:MAG: hypothetical protein ACRCYB_06350, partial [Aeromonas veronii]